MSFEVGSKAFAQNPKYRDGTRLRMGPVHDDRFNGVWLPNDTVVTVLRCDGAFAEVRKESGETGWLQVRNLQKEGRVAGVTKGVISNEVVTPDEAYVKGVRLYGVGILADPISGSKMGKGLQHLISSHWLLAMSELCGAHFKQLQALVRHAKRGADLHHGYDYVYFTNLASVYFCRAELMGLQGNEALQYLLLTAWLVMAAAEVDNFPFRKYTPAQRQAQRDAFYQSYLKPEDGPGTVDDVPQEQEALGSWVTSTSRRDLLPPVAMERLGINNELSSLKYADPEIPLREGFIVSQRIDSGKRHLESVHRRMTDEDHIIHALWNFMAIYHVCVVFPHMNDLTNYVTRQRVSAESDPNSKKKGYEPTTSLEKIKKGSFPQVLKLDWNEGTIAPPPAVCLALNEFLLQPQALRWYPELGGGLELKQALANYVGGGVIPENVLVTNGSDDALILLCHSYLKEGRKCLVPVPTYEHLCSNVEATGATLIRLELQDPFKPAVEELIWAIERHQCDVAYIVTPNNPTGAEYSPNDIQTLARQFPRTLFIVDEAYAEFGQEKSSVGLVASMPNVVVTRTFSKSFALAAARIGYLIAHPNTIERLRTHYNPKSVNQLAVVMAKAALGVFESYYRPFNDLVKSERQVFATALQKAGIDARTGGGGNFVCLRFGDKCAFVCQQLEKQGIFVRDISARFPGYIRITIGVCMERVIEAVVSIVQTMK